MSYKLALYMCSLHSLNKLFQFINILLCAEYSLHIRSKNSCNETDEKGSGEVMGAILL